MHDNIEKRTHLLTPFTYNHPLYFHRFGDYEADEQDYYDQVIPLLPSGWKIERRSAWYVVGQEGHQLPVCGFKIHLTLLSSLAKEHLGAVLMVLFKHQVKFKLVVDQRLHDHFNSQGCGKTASGKFMTIYPNSQAHFEAILKALYPVTQGMVGPYILTDKPYLESECLFYRYGAFTGAEGIDVFGDPLPEMIGKDELVPDLRKPWFELPPGIEDPIPVAEKEDLGELLHQRYRVEEALTSHSSKGGVYLAVDTETGNKVVIKEARAWINRHRNNDQDVREGLRHEEHILKRLSKTGVVPKVIDFFQEWQNVFLVQEYFELPNAKDYGVWQETNAVVEFHKSHARREFFSRRYLKLLRNLIEAVEAVHAAGIVIGDVAPQNVLYNYETLEVKLIDFEAAYDQENGAYYQQSFTPGFSTSIEGFPEVSEDLRALRAVAVHLIFPICKLFEFRAKARKEYVRSLVLDEGLPLAFIDLIETIGVDLTEAKRQIDALLADLPVRLQNRKTPEHVPLTNLNTIVQQIRTHVYDSTASAAYGTLFPADHRIFRTNALNVAYGAAGTCYFLHQTGGLSPTIRDQFRSLLEASRDTSLPPGLYVGSAGIAWVCQLLGMTREARAMMAKTYRSPLRKDHPDLFYGAAGWGLASLYFHQATGESQYLQKALEAAAIIPAMLTENEFGLHYADPHGNVYSGLMHGSSGIALFYLRLHAVTQDPEHLRLARALLQHDLDRGREEHGLLQWQRNYNNQPWEPYLRIGNVGVGTVALRFFRQTGEAEYLRWAERIADSIADQYTSQVGMFLGMAGLGSYFLDLFAITRNEKYLQQAHGFARKIMLYQVPVEKGIAFPGENLIRLTNDYGTGSAGIGLFLHRLQENGNGHPLFFELETTAVPSLEMA